jgi:single-strand DNA-binding protein
MDLNKAMIIGRLTQDPEVRTTPTGQNVATFSVATNLIWTDQQGQKQEKVEYHNVVSWRKLAEICGQYLQKGKKVYIEGRLQTRQWEGQDGVKRNRTEIIADNMIMLDSAGRSQTGSPASPQPQSDEPPVIQVNEGNNQSATDSKPNNQDEANKEKVSIEDIPF